nr:Eco57I restriction-modification methylase domain-containing protein [Leuconostoc lactis]
MKSNFEFLTIDTDTQILYSKAAEAEKLYTDAYYDSALVSIRAVAENVTKMVVDFEYIKMQDRATFDNYLREIRNNKIAPDIIVQDLYDIKKYGNDAAHSSTSTHSKSETLVALEKMFEILVWFNVSYINPDFKAGDFFEPVAEKMYQTAERKLIYIQTGDNSDGMWPAYEGAEKIGDATIEGYEYNLSPNSDNLRDIAERRINQYMTTSGAKHILQWAELAYSDQTKRWFRDHEVHEVLRRSNIQHADNLGGAEWFRTDLETAKSAIKAVKEGRSAIQEKQVEPAADIVLRPEQRNAIDQTIKVFKKPSNKKMLWNAKMRFGKTLTALQLIKEEKWQRVLIMTHRPVVSDSWFEDFGKMKMADANYRYGSKNKGEQLNLLSESDKPFIYFASIQDLRGSERVGGKAGAKNELLFDIDWDLVIIDEAHEGTQTELAQNVLQAVLHDKTKLLTLSGTPFNLLDSYDDEQVYTWDYVMEQTAKTKWSIENPDQPNPYESLPKVSMYTFEMKNKAEYADETKSFNFKEFFRVDDSGKFVHENDVNGFLNEITKTNKQTHYPFSTAAFRNELRHTLWLLPGIKEAAALKTLMDKHPIFGKEYRIINVVDNGDTADGSASRNDLERVRQAITDDPSATKTITLTVRKLTTGVNVKEWTAVMFLSNTNSAMQYLQAAFRAQTPFSDPKLGMKTNAYIFDFAPDRALTVMAESTSLGTKTGKLISTVQKQEMNKLLNFMPIIGNSGNGMKPYNVDNLLTQIKKVYAEKAVRSGFDDDSLYSDALLMLNNADVEAFKDLQKIVGSTKSEKIDNKVNVNNQGLTQEEYDTANRGEKKPKKQRTEEEQQAIDKKKELANQRKTMISILRGISIRIPMMIYGMPIDIDEDVDIDTFINNVDEQSWQEFMPKGVTKGKFKSFAKYYDADVFIEAGRIIRRKVRELDNLDPIQRAEELATIFGSFKNPDKETVLTPWRVVNMHLGKTIGGLSFFDESYTDTTVDSLPANHWINTDETSSVFREDVRILEINSKTGLYPLYAAISLYKLAFDKLNADQAGKFTAADQEKLWQDILQKNVFVVAKTPMAKTITERTLAGYRGYSTNVAFINGIVETAKKGVDEGVKKIKEAFYNMKFDVVIGNPPYQESIKGTSDSPIYHLFYDLSFKLADKVTLITPARFLFNAGKTPKSWNDKMLHDSHFKVVLFEQNSDKVFPRTDIKGGLAITLRDSDKNFGELITFTAFNELNSILKKVEQSKNFQSIANIAHSYSTYKLTEKLHKDFPDAEQMLSKGHKWDVVSNIFDSLGNVFYDIKPNDDFEYVQIIGRSNNNRTYKWIRKEYIKDDETLMTYNVLLPKVNGSGALGEVVSTPLVGWTQTFMGFGTFNNRLEADNALKYFKSKFARTMLGVLKITQDNPISTWAKVPLQDFTANSDIDWTKSVAEIDQQLYMKYGLDDTEIQFIETHVKEMV